jgi:hypothetical protein
MHPSMGHVCLAPPVIRLFSPLEALRSRVSPSLMSAAPLFSSLPSLPIPDPNTFHTIHCLFDLFVSFLQNHRLLAGPVKACHSLSKVSKSRNIPSRSLSLVPRTSQCLVLFCDDRRTLILASQESYQYLALLMPFAQH